MQLNWLSIVNAHKSTSCIEMNCAVIGPVGVDSMDSRWLFWEEVVLEYVGPGVSRHVLY